MAPSLNGQAWVGLNGPSVTRRFSTASAIDCIGVVDNVSMPPDGLAFALYYPCNVNDGNPVKAFQWFSVILLECRSLPVRVAS
ncbi:MAG: hypothetical protein HY862_01910 [Chloroflexi bacterium]|nr:hypothetical protein [Chloroflexota bacterium]